MLYESKDEMVSHPKHYNKNGIEVIDVIEAFTSDLSGIEAVDTANAIKYILRWHDKNGLQDIEKAIWYLTHLKNHLDKTDIFPMNPPKSFGTPPLDKVVWFSETDEIIGYVGPVKYDLIFDEAIDSYVNKETGKEMDLAPGYEFEIFGGKVDE